VTDELTELKTRYERIKLLLQVGQVIHSTLDPQEALQLILREAVRIMRASSGSVILINPNTQFLEIHAAQGLPPRAEQLRLKLGEGVTGWVARHGQPLRLGDVTHDPRYVPLKDNVRSELAVPLLVGGTVRGVINVDSARSNAFSAEDQELLESLAVEAARVIQNTWLFEQLRLRARQLGTLVNVSQTINSTLNLDDALHVITREACMLTQARMCSLLLVDESLQWLDLRASYGASEAYLRKPRLSIAESLLGSVVRRRKPIQEDNIQTSTRYQHPELARAEGLVSLLSVPLVFTDQVIGVLSVYTNQPYTFSNEEVRTLTAFAQLSALAIEKARLYERAVDVEEQLRQNEKLSAIGLLAAEVAHEIRNPLTVMKMLFQSLDLKFQSGDPRTKDVELIAEKMELLNKIVEQILDFARSAEPHFSAVSINQLIDDLTLLTRHKLANQRVQLVRKLDPALPLLQADATQLEQAFLNLQLNAVEAMPDGGKLTITTRVLPEKARPEGAEQVNVEFTDTGVGMTPEQQARAFFSVMNTTKTRGTGLGLAIVRRVVESHRGKLDIRSSPGKGTTISVTLPVKM
jgi:signal transduction histidine kinase